MLNKRKSLAACAFGVALMALPATRAQAQSAGHEFEGLGQPAAPPPRSAAVDPLEWQRLNEAVHEQRHGAWRDADRRFLLAAQQRRWPEALRLLNSGDADPNARDLAKGTALALAARAGGIDVVRALLAQGADPNVRGADGFTPLGAAAFAGHPLVVRALLEGGARRDDWGSTGLPALHLACATGQTVVIDELLRAGARVDHPNRQGEHALDVAAASGQMAALMHLRDAGWPLATPDAHGLNALHAAALGHQQDTAAWLQAQGVAPTTVLTELMLERMGADQP